MTETTQNDLEVRIRNCEAEIKKLKQKEGAENGVPYNKYYFQNQPQVVEKINKFLSQEGSVLELKTLKMLKKYGLTVEEFFYTDLLTKKPRQLDFKARYSHSFKIDNTEVDIRFWFLGDCKFKSHIDILFFDFKEDSSWVNHFPIPIAADLDYSFFRHFKKEVFFSSKITQLVIDGFKKSGEHLDSRFIYDAAQQVYDGVSAFHCTLKDDLKIALCSQYRKALFPSLLSSGDLKIHTWDNFGSIIEKLTKIGKMKILDGIEFLHLDFIFPIVVLDDTRGVMKAKMNKVFEITKIEDIKIGVYKFSCGFSEKIFNSINDYIIVCNLSGLDWLLKNIKTYCKAQQKYIEKTIKAHPGTVVSVFREFKDEYKNI